MAHLPTRTACSRLTVSNLSARPHPSQHTARPHVPNPILASPLTGATGGSRSVSALERCTPAAFSIPCAGSRQRSTATAAVAAEAPNADTYELPVQRGETAGAALVMEGITIQAGDRDLLEVRTSVCLHRTHHGNASEASPELENCLRMGSGSRPRHAHFLLSKET